MKTLRFGRDIGTPRVYAASKGIQLIILQRPVHPSIVYALGDQ